SVCSGSGGPGLALRRAFVARSLLVMRCAARPRGASTAIIARTRRGRPKLAARRARRRCGRPIGEPAIIRRMPDARSHTHTRPTALAVWLIVAGAVGWWAAFQLTLEKLASLADPDHAAACDFSVLVQCTVNLDS